MGGWCGARDRSLGRLNVGQVCRVVVVHGCRWLEKTGGIGGSGGFSGSVFLIQTPDLQSCIGAACRELSGAFIRKPLKPCEIPEIGPGG